MKRRDILKYGMALGGTAALPSAFAQDFPQKLITMIVPFAPGGNLDTVARLIAPALSAQLGQQVVVENRAGAGGAIGVGAVARSEPNGYNLLISTPNAVAVLPQMIKAPYTPANFQPIGLISSTSLVIVVKGDDKRFTDAASLLAFARANPKQLNVGYAGTGTTNHVGLMQIVDSAKIELNGVAYKGSASALTDLLGGQIDLVVDQLTSSVSHIKTGKLRALAVLSRNRDPLLPNIPSLQEAGLANFDVSTLTGVLAPAKTPKAVVERINTALIKALADEKLKQRLLTVGSVARTSSPQEFQTLLANEERRAIDLAKAGKLKAE
jgi:tripartite-type tricarboxylate transporter receptor subunit TctC